jgi:Domain of unknown function (DUF4129)
MKRWLPVVGVVAVLAAAWFASLFSSTDVTQLPQFPPRPSQSVKGPDGDPSIPGVVVPYAGIAVPTWLLWLIVGSVMIFIAVVIIALTWTFFRFWAPAKKARLLVRDGRGGPLHDRAEQEQAVLEALDAGLTELSDRDVDPRRAVIACWVRLETAAAEAGTPRQPGDSPTDLVTRLLSAHRVSRAVLDRFARVYREARYATLPVGDEDRQIALDALAQMRRELTEPVEVSVGD